MPCVYGKISRANGVRKLPFVFLFFNVLAYAGDWNGGATAGMTVYFGNKTNRVGIFAGAWIRHDFVQLNPGIRFCYHFKNLGPDGRCRELNSYTGLLLAWGKRDSMENPFITNVSNQTKRRNSVAYSYNIYGNNMGTSQKTGTFALQFSKISLITENDLFGDTKDRFRTGATSIQYQRESVILGVSLLMWTGEKGVRVSGTDYPSRNGYRVQGRFGQYSHGILCLHARQYLGYGQNALISGGVDAEQIRHLFQNRIIHDMAFLPARWVKNPNSHVPMLDTEGEMFLYQPGQKIRKPTPYFNAAVNPALLY